MQFTQRDAAELTLGVQRLGKRARSPRGDGRKIWPKLASRGSDLTGARCHLHRLQPHGRTLLSGGRWAGPNTPDINFRLRQIRLCRLHRSLSASECLAAKRCDASHCHSRQNSPDPARSLCQSCHCRNRFLSRRHIPFEISHSAKSPNLNEMCRFAVLARTQRLGDNQVGFCIF